MLNYIWWNRNCVWILSHFHIWFESSINDWVGDICLSKFTRCNISKVLLCFSAYHELLFAERNYTWIISLRAFVVVWFYFPKYNHYNILFYSPWFLYCLNHEFELFHVAKKVDCLALSFTNIHHISINDERIYYMVYQFSWEISTIFITAKTNYKNLGCFYLHVMKLHAYSNFSGQWDFDI